MAYIDDITPNNASSSNAKTQDAGSNNPNVKTGLVIDPPVLYLGSVIAGESEESERAFTVTNVGKKTLRIDNVALTQAFTDFTLEGSPPALLKPDEEFLMIMKYMSDTIRTDSAEVTITTNEDRGPYVLGVSARAVSSGSNEAIYDDLYARITEEAIVRAGADFAEAQHRLTLEASLNDTINAKVMIEETARVTADEALAQRIESMEATYTDEHIAGIATSIANAKVLVESTARASADEALASRIETVEANYVTHGDAESIANAAVSTEATARASADEALATRIDTVEASVVTESDVTTIATALVQTEATARADADGALANRLDVIEADYTTSSEANTIADTVATAKVATEATARATAISAEATRVDNLLTGYATSGAVTAAINAEVIARNSAISSAVGAEASRIDAVIANYTTTSGMNGAITSAINAEVINRNTAIATAVGAEATRIDSVIANYTNTSGMTSAISAAVSTEVSARTLADNALGTRIDNISATIRINNNLCPNINQWDIFDAAITLWNNGTYGPIIEGSPTTVNGAAVIARSPEFALLPGAYTLSVDLQCLSGSTSDSVYADVICYNSAGTVLLDAPNTAIANANTNFSDSRVRTTFTNTFTAPANTAKCVVRLVSTSTTGTRITSGGIRRVKLEAGSSVSPYTDEATTILNTAAIKSEVTARVNAVAAEATRVDTLLTGYATTGALSAAISSEVSSRNSAISTAVGAEASRVDTLLTGYATTGALSTAISSEVSSRNTAISNAVAAEASRIDAVVANYTTTSGMNSAITAAIGAEVTARNSAITTAVNAEASRIDAVIANYTTTSGMNGAISTAINAEVIARNSAISSQVGAEASRIDSVLATAYTNTAGMNSAISAAVSIESTARAALDTRVSAYLGLKVSAAVGGVNTVTSVELMSGAGLSKIKFTASLFEFDGDVVINGTLTATKLATNNGVDYNCLKPGELSSLVTGYSSGTITNNVSNDNVVIATTPAAATRVGDPRFVSGTFHIVSASGYTAQMYLQRYVNGTYVGTTPQTGIPTFNSITGSNLDYVFSIKDPYPISGNYNVYYVMLMSWVAGSASINNSSIEYARLALK